MSQYPHHPWEENPLPPDAQEGANISPATPGASGGEVAPVPAQPERDHPLRPARPEGRHRKGPLIPIAAVVMGLAVALFVFTQIYTLRTVEVQAPPGQEVYVDQLLYTTGLNRPVSMYSIREEAVAAAVEQEPYLDFLGLDRIWPNKVVLRVRVRQPVANLLYMGIQYLIADDGMVLERYNQVSAMNTLPVVTEMNIRDIRVGAVLTCAGEGRLKAFVELMGELTQRDMLQQTASVNMGALDAITWQTQDGFTVNLGDAQDMHGKMGTAQAVLARLRAEKYAPGIVNVEKVGEANYQPVGTP